MKRVVEREDGSLRMSFMTMKQLLDLIPAPTARLYEEQKESLIRGDTDDSRDDASLTTYFDEALEKWKDLNLTNEFDAFARSLRGLTGSFELLLHNRNKIVMRILKHGKIKHSSALPAILDLTVHLARDLREEFYQHFPQLFDLLVLILDNERRGQDSAANVNAVFHCMVFLFKNLRHNLHRNLNSFFKIRFCQLLGKTDYSINKTI